MNTKKNLSQFNLIKFACFVYFVIVTVSAFAQNYDESAAVKWNQIRTSHFKIIYPRGIDSTAQRYANILEKAYNHVPRSLNYYYKQTIPLVLHNNDLNSNAWVSFAPRQMNFMTSPINDLYVTSWDKSLALHEFRHYIQISKHNVKGILKFAGYLFGDYASVAWAGIVPDWFFEGDATLSETAMSKSGRGRMPFFFAEYRSYLLSDKNFSYDKWLQGSYKNFIPNEYAYGYIQTSYARKRFGMDVWEKTLERAQTKSVPFFGSGFKKITNISLKQLQTESFEYLKKSWEEENRKPDENINYIAGDEKNYTKYLYPYFIDEQNVIAVKHNLKTVPSLVIIDKNANEKHLADIGYYYDKIYFSDNKIYWIENIQDIRWTAKSGNTVRFYDLNSKQIKTALTRTRYRTLAFGDENVKIFAAAKYTNNDKNFICILNKTDLAEIYQIQTPKNATVVSLAINGQGNTIAASLLSDDGMSLQILDITNGKWNILIEQSFASIANISFYDENIIFNSGFDGVDNLYLIFADTKKIHRLTNSKFGAVAASHNKNNDLIYSEYYVNGLKLATKKITFDKNMFIDWSHLYKFELADAVAAQENFVIDTIDLQNPKIYNSKTYRKTANLFRIRNWLPFYAGMNPEKTITSFYGNDDGDDKLSFGATVISQNLLGNTTSQLAYSYRNNYSAIHAGFTYTGWFPVISVEGHYGGGKNLLINEGNISKGNETGFNMEATSYIPFVFSNSRYVRGIVPSIKFSVSNTKYFAPHHLSMKKANLAEYSVNAYIYKRLSKTDIFPKWGLIFNFQFTNSPFDTENFGNIYGGKITAYIPGLFINQGLQLSALYQKQNIRRYIYSSVYDFPRETGNMISKKFSMFSADYTFPIIYPDVNLGALTYVTRIRANLFYDFAQTKNANNTNNNIYSFGTDFLFDAYWFRMPYPITLGFRVYKTTFEKNIGIRLITAVSF